MTREKFKEQSENWSGRSDRKSYFRLETVDNQPVWPRRSPESPMSLIKMQVLQSARFEAMPAPNGEGYSMDFPNSPAMYAFSSQNWDERLYAGVYSAWSEACRQGSTEVGMLFVQRRQTYGMMIDAVIRALVVIHVAKAQYPRALGYLRKNPSITQRKAKKLTSRYMTMLRNERSAKERVRLSNLIYILREVSGLLLAVRYGWAPLMGTISGAAEVLSGDTTEDPPVRIKRSGKRQGSRYVWSDDNGGMCGEDGIFSQSVTIAGTAVVSNPDLLLANKLGLVNPQYWAWDATPWSFIVDWWLPVGKFLNSFTATVGLSFLDASVTRGRYWNGTLTGAKWINTDPWNPVWSKATMPTIGVIRSRTLGNPPQPFKVPYGTGLSVARAQNAYALIMQQLTKK